MDEFVGDASAGSDVGMNMVLSKTEQPRHAVRRQTTHFLVIGATVGSNLTLSDRRLLNSTVVGGCEPRRTRRLRDGALGESAKASGWIKKDRAEGTVTGKTGGVEG